MRHLLRDMRFGLRLLLKNPGFTAVAVLTLALGIAATTAIFSVVHATFFAPLPYRDADRLVMVWSQREGGGRNSNSPADYLDFKRETSVFEDLNAWTGRFVSLGSGGAPMQLEAGTPAPGFLPMLGFGHPLAIGRDFLEAEGTLGREQVVILSYSLWQERFGGDRTILGQAIRIDGKPYEVVGVLGQGPADNIQYRLWIPLALPGGGRRRPRGALPHGAGAAEAGRHGGAGQRATETGRRAAGGGVSRLQPRLDSQRRAVPQQFPEPGHEELAVAAARRGGLPAAHRLRQRRQSAPRARHRAAARGDGADGARRVAGRDRAAAPDREPGAGARRRRRRHRARVPGDAGGGRADAAVHAAVRDGDRAERAGAAVHGRALGRLGRALRHCSGLAGGAPRPERDAQGVRARGAGRAARPAPGPRRPRVRARAHAPHRRRRRALELHGDGAGRARLPH